MLDGVDDDLGAAFDVQLFEDFTDVDFDGFVADEQAVGDFFVAEPFDQAEQHFLFTLGQGRVLLLSLFLLVEGEQLPRHRRMDNRLGTGDGPDS